MKKRLPKNNRRRLARQKWQKTLQQRFQATDSVVSTANSLSLNLKQAAYGSALLGFVILSFWLLVQTPQPLLAWYRQHHTLDQATLWRSAQPVKSCRSVDPARLAQTKELTRQVASIVKHTPMERMANTIGQKDRRVAAFLVGIAMKESKFGRFAPHKNGRDCYNYWGYRGKENPTTSGYSCFDSPSHAVNVVASRIERIVRQGAVTPAAMISWKCGSSCAGHDPASVRKWISDVSINYYRLSNGKELARNK